MPAASSPASPPRIAAAHVYRALLEGVALEQTIVSDRIAATGSPIDEFVAIGGGAASDLWCQILADCTGRAVHRSATVEASSLGAADCGRGWRRLVSNRSAARHPPWRRSR